MTIYQNDFLEQFGKVRYFGLDSREIDKSPMVGFIEFEDENIAEELISRGYMLIQDKRLQIKSYNEY